MLLLQYYLRVLGVRYNPRGSRTHWWEVDRVAQMVKHPTIDGGGVVTIPTMVDIFFLCQLPTFLRVLHASWFYSSYLPVSYSSDKLSFLVHQEWPLIVSIKFYWHNRKAVYNPHKHLSIYVSQYTIFYAVLWLVNWLVILINYMKRVVPQIL